MGQSVQIPAQYCEACALGAQPVQYLSHLCLPNPVAQRAPVQVKVHQCPGAAGMIKAHFLRDPALGPKLKPLVLGHGPAAQNGQRLPTGATAGAWAKRHRETTELIGQPPGQPAVARTVQRHLLQGDHVWGQPGKSLRGQSSPLLPTDRVVQQIERQTAQPVPVSHRARHCTCALVRLHCAPFMDDHLVIGVLVGLKFLLPLLYFRRPFEAGWANLLLDSIDGDLLAAAGMAEPAYQTIDKAADYFAYVCMFIWGWQQPIRREITATFALRTIGQALFFTSRNELALFAFPNLLEPLFLVYVTIARFVGHERAYVVYRQKRALIWAGILLYKFQDEWLTHVANIDRSEALRRLLGR